MTDWHHGAFDEPRTIVETLRDHARERPNDPAIIFAEAAHDEAVLTFGALDRRARALGARLRRDVEADTLVMLPMRSDARSVVALFGCLYAGRPCAPVPLPGRNGSIRHLQAIVAASGSTVAVVPPDAVARLSEPLKGLTILIEDDEGPEGNWQFDLPNGGDLAIVQYTSGSAAEPKGVMLSHGNIAANLEMLRVAFAIKSDDIYASWLPLFHDMGLAMLLMPICFGVPGHLLPPLSFLRRPARWLQMLAETGATITGAPNFAFQLCVDRVEDADLANLDLRRVRIAFCGAEPIRRSTMRRVGERLSGTGFRAAALYPCYGMAEAVTLVSGGHLRDDPATDVARPVSCGRPAQGTTIAVIDRDTGVPRADGVIGEIWVAGPQVGAGYYGMAAATTRDFGARLATMPHLAFLRTGDLGFMTSGEITITGRTKDVLIYRGTNLHAVDLEAVVAASHPGFGHTGAAFIHDDGETERMIVVQEATRGGQPPDLNDMHLAAGRALAFHFGLRLHDLVIVRPGSIPKTSSGKVRREACRDLYARGQLRFAGGSKVASPPVGLTSSSDR